MRITVTTSPRELADRGVWQQACEMLGMDDWVLSEGGMDSDASILLSEWQAYRLGMVSFRPGMEMEPDEISGTGERQQ
jgi:hypothetical protein